MKKDILGKALLDYFQGNYSEDILTETNISDQDDLPLPYLFRDFKDMPKIEQEALKHCKGKVLDVGCGAGSHALYLLKKGLEVTAIDISEGAVEVSKLRGITDVGHVDVLDLKEDKFDTILMLMNGTGIFKNLASAPTYLKHLKSLLNPEGHILIDSSDIIYMFDTDDDEGVWIPTDKDYYGELMFKMTYKKETSETFEWLYLDFNTLQLLSEECGLDCEMILEGEHFDYLAKLTLKNNRT
ncbi:MAG: class I SAM-dependent methyltransferase [Flavobacteriaceae bacterium]